jgi:PKHD-type hydroxylase
LVPIPPIAAPLAPAVSIGDVFTVAALDGLEHLASTASEVGETGGGGTKRRSKVRFLDYELWLYSRIVETVARVNAQYWHFDLAGVCELVQLARYEADDKGEYDWHQDFGNNTSSRKLSLSVQLTDDTAYEGGDLQIFKAAGEVMNAPRQRGTFIVFPSYQLHRITPVTRGVRHSLVAWISGPAFR